MVHENIYRGIVRWEKNKKKRYQKSERLIYVDLKEQGGEVKSYQRVEDLKYINSRCVIQTEKVIPYIMTKEQKGGIDVIRYAILQERHHGVFRLGSAHRIKFVRIYTGIDNEIGDQKKKEYIQQIALIHFLVISIL